MFLFRNLQRIIERFVAERESPHRGIFVDGLNEECVTSIKDIYDILEIGNANRRVASTSMNFESSRSHALFFVEV